MSKVKFTTTIDANLLEQIKIIAIKEKRSVSDILEELISKYVSMDDKRD
nr:MAG TPA: antitoxin [Caudoviricetes sp.]